jgi:transposase
MPLYVANREDMEHLIVTMHADGVTIRAISRHFEIGRNTVRRILRGHDRQRREGHEAFEGRFPRKSQLDPYLPLMRKLLEEFPDLTGLRMFEELKAAG